VVHPVVGSVVPDGSLWCTGYCSWARVQAPVLHVVLYCVLYCVLYSVLQCVLYCVLCCTVCCTELTCTVHGPACRLLLKRNPMAPRERLTQAGMENVPHDGGVLPVTSYTANYIRSYLEG